MTPAAASLVVEPGALAQLRRSAASDAEASNANLRAVAEQFESLFTHMVLKNMRAASLAEGAFDGTGTEFYQDMFDQQLSSELSRGTGLGLADVLFAQLGGKTANAERGAGEALAVPERNDRLGVTRTKATAPAAIGSDAPPATPVEFVERLLPHAQRVAEKLGIAPQLILAQAALETGWGKRRIPAAGGGDSFNYFGIKAGPGWQGERAVVSTLEFRDGLPQRERAAFRAYQDPAAGFDDYARLISSSSRYRAALGAGSDARAFGEALQAGGYATDPQYASKLARVADSPVFHKALIQNGQTASP